MHLPLNVAIVTLWVMLTLHLPLSLKIFVETSLTSPTECKHRKQLPEMTIKANLKGIYIHSNLAAAYSSAHTSLLRGVVISTRVERQGPKSK